MMSRYWMVVLVGVLIVVMSTSLSSASESDDMEYDDAIKVLQSLERYYSQVARPRRGQSKAGASEMELSSGAGFLVAPPFPRAVRLLQLHAINQIYSHPSRPRFGKRSFTQNAVPKENMDENRLEKLFGFAQTR